MKKPEMSLIEVEELIPEGVTEKLVVVGIRGYYKKTMGDPTKNDRNIYDDAFFVISPTVFKAFNANTDPSVTRKGVAVLKPGVYYYKKGKHGISRPGGGYWAFRPATKDEMLPVTRDGIGDSMAQAINIHRGSYASTSSLGCQTIYPEQWEEFKKLVYDQMSILNQDTFPYVLVEA